MAWVEWRGWRSHLTRILFSSHRNPVRQACSIIPTLHFGKRRLRETFRYHVVTEWSGDSDSETDRETLPVRGSALRTLLGLHPVTKLRLTLRVSAKTKN